MGDPVAGPIRDEKHLLTRSELLIVDLRNNHRLTVCATKENFDTAVARHSGAYALSGKWFLYTRFGTRGDRAAVLSGWAARLNDGGGGTDGRRGLRN